MYTLPKIPDFFGGMKVIKGTNPKKAEMNNFMSRKPLLTPEDKDLNITQKLKKIGERKRSQTDLNKEHKAVHDLESVLDHFEL